MIQKPTAKGKSKPKTKLQKPTMPIPADEPASAPVANFTVEPWQTNDGKRIIIYADTGIGKSTLARLAPVPVWLGLDDGAGELKKPGTDDPLDRIPGLKTFADVRTALQQVSLFNNFKTVVIDHTTILQDWAIDHVINTIPTKGGDHVANIEAYGWKEGYRHLYDVMRGPLADCDELIRRGKNVILIAQGATHRVQHPGAVDYLRAGPRLYGGKPSVEALYCEWASYILRIDYHNVFISKERKISGATERAIYVQPEVWFRAKTRTPWYDKDGDVISTVTFQNPDDDSIWQFIFDGGE